MHRYLDPRFVRNSSSSATGKFDAWVHVIVYVGRPYRRNFQITRRDALLIGVIGVETVAQSVSTAMASAHPHSAG